MPVDRRSSARSWEWLSADAGVATVDDEGLLTAITVGATTVSATLGSLSTNVPVTVTVTPESVVVSPTTVDFTSLGDTATVVADVRDGSGDPIVGAGVVWTSSDPAVVSVSGGLLTSNGTGSAMVVATAGPVVDTVDVTVSQVPAGVSVSPDSVVLNGPGDTLTVGVAVLDAGGSPIPGAPVTWTSTDESIVTVSSTGRLAAVAPGATTVVAASGAFSAIATVAVTQTPASITLAPDSVTLTEVGDTATIVAVVRDAGGDEIVGARAIWSSSDTAIAVVSTEGLVTAVAFGTVTVTARAGELIETVPVVVEQLQAAPSFADEVTPIFISRGCTAANCHGGGAGNLTLTGTSSTSYANLVNVAASAEPTLLRVKPNDAQNSYLIMKLENRQASGARMPIGRPALNTTEIGIIRRWIDLGAPNN